MADKNDDVVVYHGVDSSPERHETRAQPISSSTAENLNFSVEGKRRRRKPRLSTRFPATQNAQHVVRAVASTTFPEKVLARVKRYEKIETHFINNDAIYFVVCNEEAGRINVGTRQRSHPIYYAIKPQWYMAGTPALRDYYDASTMDEEAKALVPVAATLADNIYAARPMNKNDGLAHMYRCVVEAKPDDPRTSVQQREYTLYIPEDWSQLARHRLFHHRIDSVTACATMLVSAKNAVSGGHRPSRGGTAKIDAVTVYVVRWQNESQWTSELLPVQYVQTFTQHDYHHHMILDYWEEACVQDSRDFRSASSVSYSRQDTALMTNVHDQYWIKCVHRFRGRQYWTDVDGLPSIDEQRLYVYKCIDYPLTIGWVLTTELPGTDIDTPQIEKEEDDIDPPGFDEYVQLVVYGKFARAKPHSSADFVDIKAEDLSLRKSTKNHNTVQYTAHVPRNWRLLGEQHAGESDEVKILGVFKQMAIANVYLVQWPTYEHPTIVASLTLRKRHARQLLAYFEHNVYMPKLQLLKPDWKSKS